MDWSIERRIKPYPRLKLLMDYFRDLGVLLLMAAGARASYLLLRLLSEWMPVEGHDRGPLSYLSLDPIRWTVTAFDFVTMVSVGLLTIFSMIRFARYLQRLAREEISSQSNESK